MVVRVGIEVKEFKVGDEVYGETHEHAHHPKDCGSLAEYTAVDEKVWVSPRQLVFLSPLKQRARALKALAFQLVNQFLF